MSKKKAILTTLGALGAIAATGGLASIGIPGLVGGSSGMTSLVGAEAAKQAAARTGMSLATKLALAGAAAQAGSNIYGAHTQASAANQALAAQTAASNQALEYQKEQDRIERERQAHLDALKEDADRYERQRLERRTALEQNRYGDFTNNIAPYLSTGASANAQIANLFGFPAPAPYVPRPTQGPGGGVPFNGSDTPLDSRPRNDFPEAGSGAPVSTTMPVPNAPTSGPELMVTMRAPDGTTKAVRASEVPHYEQLGAVRVA